MAPSSPRRAHSRARRAYGQNFLSSSTAVRTVADAASLKPDDLVYEVGAGRGRLTSMLLARAGRVVAFEVDPVMAGALPGAPHLEVRVADFLRATSTPAKRTGDYGRWSRLTILSWPTHHWELAGRIPRTAFRPVPRVDGGVLRIVQRDLPLVASDDLPDYRSFVSCGFTGVGGSLSA